MSQKEYFFVILEEGNETKVECEHISLVAFRPKMRALYFENQEQQDQAMKQLKELGIKFENN
jgi:hypothetical protein